MAKEGYAGHRPEIIKSKEVRNAYLQ